MFLPAQPFRALGALFALLLLGSAAAPAGEFFTDLTFDKALAKAQEEGKYLFIDFMADWCAPCKLLDRTTWKDEQVARLVTEQAVAIKIDIDERGELASRFGVRALPTMMLVGPGGQEIDRIVGYVDPEAFQESFKDILPKA